MDSERAESCRQLIQDLGEKIELGLRPWSFLHQDDDRVSPSA